MYQSQSCSLAPALITPEEEPSDLKAKVRELEEQVRQVKTPMMKEMLERVLLGLREQLAQKNAVADLDDASVAWSAEAHSSAGDSDAADEDDDELSEHSDDIENEEEDRFGDSETGSIAEGLTSKIEFNDP